MARAIWKGAVIAESDACKRLKETHTFLHRRCGATSCARARRTPSATGHWKGTASYYDFVVGDKVNKDAVWHYHPDPKPAAANIKEYVAFSGGVRVEPWPKTRVLPANRGRPIGRALSRGLARRRTLRARDWGPMPKLHRVVEEEATLSKCADADGLRARGTPGATPLRWAYATLRAGAPLAPATGPQRPRGRRPASGAGIRRTAVLGRGRCRSRRDSQRTRQRALSPGRSRNPRARPARISR